MRGRVFARAALAGVGAVVGLSVLAEPAVAVIARIYPLGEVIAGADTIAECRVSAAADRKQSVKLERNAALKGAPGWKSLLVRLTGGDDRTQAPVLAERLKAGRTVTLFRKANRFTLGYVEGTWFRLAEPAKSGAPWQFVHLEPYLRRTYRGTNAELRAVITAVLAGKANAPAPDPAAKPGYGS